MIKWDDIQIIWYQINEFQRLLLNENFAWLLMKLLSFELQKF